MATVNRQFLTFYGIYLYDWDESFGVFSNTHYLMARKYENEAVSSLDSSEASNTHYFLYPFDIERQYYIEGTAKGQICLAAVGCTSTITDYRVTLCKVHDDNTETELGTTGWRTVNDTLAWDAGLSIGEEMVYPYYIHISPEEQLIEKERLYLKIEVNCNSCTHLYHSNDTDWEDIKLDIPFMGI